MIHLIYRKFGQRFYAKDDVLSGLTVALALVPEAVAFAIIAGVGPLVGLYAAFFVCLITSIAGGRPGMISGATGALAVIMVGLVKLGDAKGVELGLGEGMGLQYLFAAVILMGIIQIGCGVLKLGRFYPSGARAGDVWFCERVSDCDLSSAVSDVYVESD